jgi:ABC-type nitrate/sulfonate/bicarbonate transport system substrate-binding protein
MTLEFDRRTLLKAASASAVGGALSIGAATGAAAAAAPLKIGSFFIAIDYAPYLIAKSKGMFEKIGGATTVQYTTFQSLPPVNEAMATQQVDAVFEAEPPALIGRAAGIDVKIVEYPAAWFRRSSSPTNRMRRAWPISRVQRSPFLPEQARTMACSNC